jgi:ketosteroid isomerase-like protein
VREETNADLARRGFELWNQRRFEDVLGLFHEDAVWDMRPFPGVPDSSVEVEGVEQSGDWTMTLVLQMVSGGAAARPSRSAATRRAPPKRSPRVQQRARFR